MYSEYVQNGEHHFQLNGIRHWVRIAGAQHKTTPLVIAHGGPGGSVYTFEQTIGKLLENQEVKITDLRKLYFKKRFMLNENGQILSLPSSPALLGFKTHLRAKPLLPTSGEGRL